MMASSQQSLGIRFLPVLVALGALPPACGGGAADGGSGSGGSAVENPGGPVDVENPLTDPADGPPAGNAEGGCDIPEAAAPEDVSGSTNVIGDGTPASCTADAVVEGVAKGGVITFDCGPDPIVITLDRPAKIVNDTGPEIVIDGGGLVTLSGGGATRILYMNTCDEAQKWTTAQCDNQDHPRLTIQNLTFVDGNAKEYGTGLDGGGGAIWARGGRIKIVNSRFFNNVCVDDGPDVGGGGIRVFSQFDGLPVYLTNSTFGGAPGLGNVCSNGGGISSIGVSWTVINSLFSHNEAIGGVTNMDSGGNGGGIYNDGNTMTLSLCGTRIESNTVRTHGSGVFFVSNDHSGDIVIEDSILRDNQGGSWYALPGISMHEDTRVTVDEESVLEE